MSAPTPIGAGTVTPVTIRARPSQAIDHDMPAEGPLIDRFGRVHRDLRLSITDRCNLRCVYCMPEDMTLLPRTTNCSPSTRSCASPRSRTTWASRRFTPPAASRLVRPWRPRPDRAALQVGFDDLSLTTNGTELARLAPGTGHGRARPGEHELRLASADTLAGRIRRRGHACPGARSDGRRRAIAGYTPVKVNVVLMAGG